LSTAIERLIELDEQESAKQRERATYLSLLNAVIEALPDALVVTDASGKIVMFNERSEFMFGYPRSEVIGGTVETLLPARAGERHAHDREIYTRFEITQRSRTMGVGLNLLGTHKDGHEFPVDITLARMIAPQGIYNLALVRFSPRVIPPGVERTSGPQQNSGLSNAGR
jgi:PAS domain S-box-containing protein